MLYYLRRTNVSCTRDAALSLSIRRRLLDRKRYEVKSTPPSKWLNRFEGVGPKTTACVLLFSCHKPVLPVDTHVHRGSIRLGLIGKKVSADAAHTLLQALPPQASRRIYNSHNALRLHERRRCFFNRP